MSISYFEEKYLAARNKENRTYSDVEVGCLPDISQLHPHYKEWLIRKKSSERLITYLKNKNMALSILEIGCGNGWLSGQLSRIPNSTITGLDINNFELQQARRVFKSHDNIEFIHGTIKDNQLEERRFDIILFAASIQYFASINDTLVEALQYLKTKGEIHIIDTYWYKPEQVAPAKQRTKIYYHSLGTPEMAEYYFHHCIDDIKKLNYKILYNPFSLTNKLLRNKYPFHWICITKN